MQVILFDRIYFGNPSSLLCPWRSSMLTSNKWIFAFYHSSDKKTVPFKNLIHSFILNFQSLLWKRWESCSPISDWLFLELLLFNSIRNIILQLYDKDNRKQQKWLQNGRSLKLILSHFSSVPSIDAGRGVGSNKTELPKESIQRKRLKNEKCYET